MRRRRRLTKCSPLLLVVALVAWWGCAPQADRGAAAAPSSRLPVTRTVPLQHVTALQSELSDATDRVHDLEQQLAERDRQIAAVRSAIATGSGRPDSATPTAPELVGPPAPAQQPASAAPPAESAAAQPDVEHPPAAPAGPSAAAPVPAPGAPAGTAVEQRLANAQRRIAALQKQLTLEVKRRQDVEAEMSRLLQETSAGPFEHADDVVEKHLREELARARKEVSDLRGTLITERREREDLERRYAALQAQTTATAAAGSGAPSEEVEALRERQRRVLASIQQELEASKQREAELRQSLEGSQGSNGVSVADEVANLRSSNSALQLRLEDEHQRNRDLSAKLQLATRVTDLIFKMQSAGVQSAQPVAAVAPPAAAP